VKNLDVVTRCAAPDCGGRVEPGTDGRGGTVDRCRRCGLTPADVARAGPLARSRAAGAPTFLTGRKCLVEGCPGTLDQAGVCACCQRRKEWVAENSRMFTCIVCGGVQRANPRARTSRYCAACFAGTTAWQRARASRAASAKKKADT
jgi:hypothetical protein